MRPDPARPASAAKSPPANPVHGIEEAEQRTAVALALSRDALLLAGPDGRVIAMNAAAEELTGWPLGEGRDTALDILAPLLEDATGQATEPLAARALRDGRDSGPCGPKLLKTRAGTTIPVDARAVPVLVGGEVTGVVLQLQDLRPRRSPDDAVQWVSGDLRVAQRMETIQRLVSGAAHDFNNLLTILAGDTELLLDGPELDPSAGALVEEIRQVGVRATALTRQLTMFALRHASELSTFDLRPVLRAIQPLLRRQSPASSDSVKVDLHRSPQPLPVRADPALLELAIINAALTVRDAIPRGGVLTFASVRHQIETEVLRAHPEMVPGEYIELVISASDRSHDDQHQAVGADQAVIQNVGMAMVYTTIRQAGGFLYTGVSGAGRSALTIYLPVAAEADHEPPANRLPSELKGQERVLMVEEDDTLRARMSDALRALGYVVIEARDDNTARELAAQPGLALDVLATSIDTAVVDHLGLAHAVAALHPAVRVLYVTSHSRSGAQDMPLPSGAVSIAKPYTPRDLAVAIRQAIHSAR